MTKTINVRKRTGSVDIQKELRKTEIHPYFNVTLVSDDTINISGRKSIRRNKFERKAYALKRPLLKTLFFIGMMCFIFGCLFIFVSMMKTPVNANGICSSAKCEVRLMRIQQCKEIHKSKEAIVDCAMIRTVKARKQVMKVSDFRMTKEEVGDLYDMMYKKPTVYHIDWGKDDEKQKILQKLYEEGKKQGVDNLPNMLGTFLGENGTLDMKRRSNTSYYRGGKKYYDYGICQISNYYHKKIVNDKRFFTDIDFQVENCVRLYKGGTKFYGKVHKEKMKKKLIFE